MYLFRKVYIFHPLDIYFELFPKDFFLSKFKTVLFLMTSKTKKDIDNI